MKLIICINVIIVFSVKSGLFSSLFFVFLTFYLYICLKFNKKMGTNYYAVMTLNNIDKETAIKLIENDEYEELKDLLDKKCGKVHIGKSSCGWKFLFNWNKGKYYDPLKTSINDFLERHRVVDEYGGEIALKEFWDMVESKQDGMDNEGYYEKYENDHNCKIGFGETYYNPQLEQYNPKFYEFYSDGLRFSTVTDFS